MKMQSQNEPNPKETEFLPPYADADAPAEAGRVDFHIDSENAANWYLRKLANIEAEKARVQSQAGLIVAQLDSEANGLRFCYEGELQEYVRRELVKKGSRRKSLILLQGTCQFRTVPAGVKLVDLASATHYAACALPELVKMVPTLDTLRYRSAALTALAKTAEVLPGCETTTERESFSVKFGGK